MTFVVHGRRFAGSGEGMVIGLGCGGGILVDCGENSDKQWEMVRF